MICYVCTKDGEVRPSINGSPVACDEHFRVLERLQEQQKKRTEVRERVLKRQAELKINASHFLKRKTRYITKKMMLAGMIERKSCEVCGDEKSQEHHNDYQNPMDVTFLCEKHHREHHKNQKL